MSFNVKALSVFERQARRLIRKYPSLKKELQTLIDELKEVPEKGTTIGHGCYKVRLAIASKGKGKSGEARVITHLVFKMIPFTCSPFMISPTLKTLPITRFLNW